MMRRVWIVAAVGACLVMAAWGFAALHSAAQGVANEPQSDRAEVGLDNQAMLEEASEAAQAERTRALADMKAHPERYRCAWEHTFSRKELGMSWGVKASQTIGTAHSGTLWASLYRAVTENGSAGGFQSVSASCMGASASLSLARVGGVSGPWDNPIIADDPGPGPEHDAIMSWAMTMPSTPYVEVAHYALIACTATAGGSTQTTYYCAGLWYSYGDGPPGIWGWLGPSEITVAYTLGSDNIYRRVQVTDNVPTGKRLRHPMQRTAEQRWYANADSTCRATCGNASTSGNYGASTESQVTVDVTLAVSYNAAPATNTEYARVSVVDSDLSKCTFWYVSGAWVYSATQPEGATWKTVVTGGGLSIVRLTDPSSSNAYSAAFAVGSTTIYPRLWVGNKKAGTTATSIERYTSYDNSAGEPFDISRRRVGTATSADVSVAPSWDGYKFAWASTSGVPEDVWNPWQGSSSAVLLRADWLVANGEDVAFAGTNGEVMDPLADVPVPLALHDLTAPLTGPPWKDDWLTWEWVELNLDQPIGCIARPSVWTGSGGVSFDADGKWVIWPENWHPVENYDEGRIDYYEGVPCHGICFEFAERFYNMIFGIYGIFTDEGQLRETELRSRNDVIFTDYTNGALPPVGALIGIDEPGPVEHVGIVDSVESDGIWLASSNRNGDLLGYYEWVYFSEEPPLWWIMPKSGHTVSRALATRRRNRMTRFSAHQWPTLAEVAHEWPLMTKANLPIATTGDDPNWWDPLATPHTGEEAGVTYEDITDWRSFGIVELTATGATQDIPVTLRLTYRTLSGEDPLYTGAEYNFGASGEAYGTWSAPQTYEVTGTLTSGKARFDLCPDSGDAVPNLELVEQVEFVFGATAATQALTLTGWHTATYDPVLSSYAVRMRIAHDWVSDYWGAQVSFDGAPNYKPSYLYTQGNDRVEVGFKSMYPVQHNPDYVGDPDDPNSIKSLAQFAGEWGWAEHVMRPTWSQTAVDAATVDVDSNLLAAPLFGDMDEFGFALHVASAFPMSLVVYADIILQGGVRGVAKAGGVRQINSADDAVKLYQSADGGTTKALISSAGTSEVGEYIIPGGKELGYTYYLGAGSSFINLGSFADAELAWAACYISQPGQVAITDSPFGQLYRARVDGSAVIVEMLKPSTWTWVNVGTALSGKTYTNPSITFTDTGRCLVFATANNATDTALATLINGADADWRALVSNPASGLENATGVYRHGGLHIVGYASGSVYYRQGEEIAGDAVRLRAFPGGSATDKTVCSIAAAPLLSVTITDTDRLVVFISPTGAETQTWTQQGLTGSFVQQV